MLKLRTPRLFPNPTSKRMRRKSRQSKRRSVNYQALEPKLPLATFVVNTLLDYPIDSPADGLISLREAVAAANANAVVGDAPAGSEQGDRIIFAPDLFANDRIVLTEGEMVIEDDLVIRGAQINAALKSRVFSVSSGGDLNLRESWLFNGEADTGGLLFIDSGSRVVLFGSTFTSSSASGDGGAVYALDSTVISNGSYFNENDAGAHGGAISVSGGSLSLIQSNFGGGKGNQANSGGAIAAFDGTKLVSDSVFRNNTTASGDGGAIFLAEGTTANLFGGYFESNGNGDSIGGGAVFSRGDGLYVTNTVFERNSGRNGGAIFAIESEVVVRQSIFRNNHASYQGGGIYLFNPSSAYLIDSTFEWNDAENNGGAIAVSSEEDSPKTVVLKELLVDTNTALFFGGGVYAYDTNVRVIDSQIESNSARQGGGIHHSFGGLFMHDTRVEGNIGRIGNGGGIFSDGEAQIIDSTIVDNRGMHSFSKGGGLMFVGDHYRRLLRTNVSGNSSYEGGGIFVQEGTLAAVSSTFRSNNSSSSGGAVAVGRIGRFISRLSSYTSNLSGQGGAIYTLGLTNVIDSGFGLNYAKSAGGALVVDMEGRMFVSSSRFSLNSARGEGAAIHAKGESVSMIDGSEFENNLSTDLGTESTISVIPDVSFHKVSNSTFSSS